MAEKSNFRVFQSFQTRPLGHRLRRYSHNRLTQSVSVMAGEMLHVGNRRTTYFVLLVLLMSTIPLATNASADQGIPAELQAQEISAVFDDVSETTTVTWRNIEQSGGDIDLFEELWDATYHVYRSASPITPENILSLTPWHTVVALSLIHI